MNSATWHFEVDAPESGRSFEAYVGLVRDRDTGLQTLRLPIGYATLPVDDRHRCLGEVTRVIAHFCTLFSENRASEYPRDGYLRQAHGQHLAAGENTAPEFSRIHTCLQLMRRLKDPALLSVVRKPGITTQFSDRQISRSLEHAHFLDDGTPVFELMWGQPQQIRRDATDLVGLAAWVALDALSHLFPDIAAKAFSSALRAEWELLAERFAADFDIDRGASLFTDASGRILTRIRDAHETLRRTNPVMLMDARQLHELLDTYLNHALSDGGEIRGLKGFSRVWEAACLHHARSQYGDGNIFTCDDELATNVARSTREQWRRNRERVFARNGTARRPDLVVREEGGRYRIIDFKYSQTFGPGGTFLTRRPTAPDLASSVTDAKSLARLGQEWKAHQDVSNLEAYRWLLMQHELKSYDERQVDIELWVPALTAGTEAVAWQARVKGRSVPESNFIGLSVRYQQAAKLLSDFASAFELL